MKLQISVKMKARIESWTFRKDKVIKVTRRVVATEGENRAKEENWEKMSTDVEDDEIWRPFRTRWDGRLCARWWDLTSIWLWWGLTSVWTIRSDVHFRCVILWIVNVVSHYRRYCSTIADTWPLSNLSIGERSQYNAKMVILKNNFLFR